MDVRSIAVASVITAIGCGGGDGHRVTGPLPADTAVSGSRLKLAWYELPGGVRTWAMVPSTPQPTPDLLDAELGVRCTPVRWSDGVTRCTPELGDVFFTDAGCTDPMIVGGSSTGTAFAAEHTAGCVVAPTGPVYVADGEAVHEDVLWYHVDGACESVMSGPSSQLYARPVSAVHPPSMLVTVDVEDQGEGARAIATLVGDDGLIVPLAPHDVARDVTCELAPLANTAGGPCLIAEAAYDLVFLDDACLHPGVQVAAGCARPPLAMMNTLGCPRYFEVSATVEGSGGRYQDAYGSCNLDGGNGGPAFALGAAVDPGALTRAAEPGTARAALVYVGYGDARMRDAPRLFDRDLGAECELDVVADGAISQCLPRGALPMSDLFADASCTQAIPDLAERGDETCIVTTEPALVQTADGLHRVGARHPGLVYEQFGTSCTPLYGALYDLGARVDVAPMTATKVRDQ